MPAAAIGSSSLSRSDPLDMVNCPAPRLLYTCVAMAFEPTSTVLDEPSEMVSIRRRNVLHCVGVLEFQAPGVYPPLPFGVVFCPDPTTMALAA
jgi:hypothetical protein